MHCVGPQLISLLDSVKWFAIYTQPYIYLMISRSLTGTLGSNQTRKDLSDDDEDLQRGN